jgi:hypothetical protein
VCVASNGKCEPFWNSTVAECNMDLAGVATLCNTLDDFLYTWCGGPKHDDDAGSIDGASPDASKDGASSE